MAAFVDGSGSAPVPSVCTRTDGVRLLYPGAVNAVFGDPEGGKTWLALAAAVEVLQDTEGRVLLIDLDHNGPQAIWERLSALGADGDVIKHRGRFRYIQPDSSMELDDIVRDMRDWRPTFVCVDSMGELLPLFHAKSNDSDDFTRVNRTVLRPFARTGATVLYVDHLSKGVESRNYGASGTHAKYRAVDGSYLRVTMKDPFARGQGGSAHLTVRKDRHGSLREFCSQARDNTGEQYAGLFTLTDDGGRLTWAIHAPREGEQIPTLKAPSSNVDDWVQKIAALDPPAKSGNDAHRRLGGKKADLLAAYKQYCGLSEAA
ncbi:AAA family ATPase [Nocardia abscessus]|uniref:AAA family ATPase n=1 Tax=Nocardia abscessus TaxID=120957 RepID=UPI001893F7D8|nr:AAA family ATPase [Nocardia abscessus]MBF6336026.1 AAA family ATPase [Nocardia abscessus]